MSVPDTPSPAFRAGYAGLIGRPNAGKSTLLNRLLGEKISITSARPQTTRNRIVGIYNAPGVQVVLLDTPGIHKAWTPLNRSMVRAALDALEEVDVAVWLVDAAFAAERMERGGPPLDAGDRALAERMAGVRERGTPVVLAPNKIDRVKKPLLLPLVDAYRQEVELDAVVPISALRGDGVAELLAELQARLPEHPPFYPPDQLADQSERFVVAEIVREKIFRLTRRELPYSTAVEVESFDESEREGADGRPGLVRIHARILVERPSQKAIVIGKGGSMLKRIGTEARKDIERLLGCRVHLSLFVKVEKDWSRNPRLLRQLGYD